MPRSIVLKGKDAPHASKRSSKRREVEKIDDVRKQCIVAVIILWLINSLEKVKLYEHCLFVYLTPKCLLPGI